MSQHTEGPLTRIANVIDINDGDPLARQSLHLNTEANARRVVAAWNACEGISTEMLEFHMGDKVRIEWMCERDELIAALRDAELFLRVGSAHAPDQFVSDQNKASGEWLKTRGLATTMLRVADAARALLAKVSA